MLPSWCDRLHIVLAPDRVSVQRLGKGLKPVQTFSQTLPCQASEEGEPVWQPALNALRELMEATPGRAEAVVLLSNHFIRYQLIPIQPDLSLDEESAYVRFSFTEIYGEEANSWSLRWDAGLSLGPQVASAVDQSLLEALDALAVKSGVRITSSQPYLMIAFNRVRKQKFDRRVMFVLVEEGRACLGTLLDGEWRSMRVLRLGQDWADELPMLIGRELQISGLAGEQGQMLLCLPTHIDRSRLAIPGWSLRIVSMQPETLIQGKVQFVSSMEVQ